MASKRKPRRPAITAEGRETQLISLAFDLAEKQLIDGSASSQVITQFLKLGSSRGRLEERRLENENLLLAAKVEQIASQRRMEDLYDRAIKAMRTYAGQDEMDGEEEYYDEG